MSAPTYAEIRSPRARWQQDDRPSAWLFVPYLAWVSFAALLNVSIAVLN